MDSFSFLKAIAKATYETMTYAPLDNEGKCPYCMNPFYGPKNKIHEGMDEVECLNCHKRFFISHPRLLK